MLKKSKDWSETPWTWDEIAAFGLHQRALFVEEYGDIGLVAIFAAGRSEGEYASNHAMHCLEFCDPHPCRLTRACYTLDGERMCPLHPSHPGRVSVNMCCSEDAMATYRAMYEDEAEKAKTGNQDLAHELWATAQLLPGEGIEDGVSRIVAILDTHDQAEVERLREATCEHCGRSLPPDGDCYGCKFDRAMRRIRSLRCSIADALSCDNRYEEYHARKSHMVKDY